MSDTTAILDRLAKLQSLAEQAGTEHEAEVAAQKMARLMLEHDVTLEMARRADHRTSGPTVTEDMFVSPNNQWRMLLLNAVAKAHLCRVIRMSGHMPGDIHKIGLVVFGEPQNLVVVRQVWDWLQTTAVRLSKAAFKVAAANGCNTGESKWSNAYRTGFTVGIHRAYTDMRRDAERDLGASFALVPVIENAVAQRVNEVFGEVKMSNKPATLRTTTGDAFHQGVNDGLRTNLGTQVGGEARTAIAG